MRDVFLLHILATLMMCGIIWIIQCLHYPLFAYVGESAFQQYEILHRNWISPIVGPLMLFELGTAIFLVLQRPQGVSVGLLWLGLALVGIIWLSTWFLQVPLHNAITHSYDAEAIAKLVKSNWIRTIAWSLRAILLLYILRNMLPAAQTTS
ncbi:MAG: hypothetical protein AAF696_27145 [Bacteroidota bacterium]